MCDEGAISNGISTIMAMDVCGRGGRRLRRQQRIR